jgi:hypothetical protein
MVAEAEAVQVKLVQRQAQVAQAEVATAVFNYLLEEMQQLPIQEAVAGVRVLQTMMLAAMARQAL